MQKHPLTARSKQQGSELLLPRELAATARTVGVEDLPVNVQMALQFPEYSEYFKTAAPVLSPRILEQLGDPYALPISQRYITGTKNPFGPGTPDTMSQDIIEKIVADYKYKLEYDKSIDPKKTIDKIKKASKFHSAPELVEKYGLKLLEERLDTGIELAGPQQFNSGGIVYASKGSHINFQPRGTDTVPAMLTPGEFVVNRAATQKNLPLLKSINSGAKGYERGGAAYLAGGGFGGMSNAKRKPVTPRPGGGAGGTGSYTTGDRTFGYSGPGLGFVAPAGMDPSKMTLDQKRKYSGLRPAAQGDLPGTGSYTTGDRQVGYSGPGGGYSPQPLTKEQSDA